MVSADFDSLPTFGRSLIKVENVEEIIKRELQEVPERYVRHDEQIPSIPHDQSDSKQNVPIIDMGKIAQAHHREEEIKKIAQACDEWGFFQVVNHGIPHSLIDRVKRIGKEFFQLPLEKKQRYSVRPGNLQGYGQTFVVSESQKLDWGNLLGLIMSPPECRDMNLWPTEPADFRENVDAYNSEIKRLAGQLLALIAESLQLPADYFEKKFSNAYQKMRMNYYPPCLRPDLVLGLSAHADQVALALLLQDDEVPGLQIHKDNQWKTVQSIPNALVINIGNVIEVMTNGRYKSVVHRAITNKEKARLSIGVFYAPGFTQEISPAPELIDDNHPCLFRKFIHQDYMQDYYSRGNSLGAKAKSSFYEYARIKK
ncbi:protein SRG1-like [Cryptomeria japonica]|uniref:protein SRG1-like n=1 Tax=Cryptomeria japonica TaxID=3369 RepID=UPI0027D9FA07|nr:protein SRG1-like [Cryptomeria japonica]